MAAGGTINGLPKERNYGCCHSGNRPATLTEAPPVHRNLSPPQLVEAAIARGEASLAANGALTALTGSRTGRSPKDKFTVEDEETHSRGDWGKVNQPFEPAKF